MSPELATAIIEAFEEEHDDVLEVIEEGAWEQECKYQTCMTVIRWKPTGLTYGIAQSRSGSYHTDWYYDDPEVFQVVPKVITQTLWEVVK